MAIVNCADCGRFFDLNEVRSLSSSYRSYVPRCREHDAEEEHMEKEEFAEWLKRYPSAKGVAS